MPQQLEQTKTGSERVASMLHVKAHAEVVRDKVHASFTWRLTIGALMIRIGLLHKDP